YYPIAKGVKTLIYIPLQSGFEPSQVRGTGCPHSPHRADLSYLLLLRGSPLLRRIRLYPSTAFVQVLEEPRNDMGRGSKLELVNRNFLKAEAAALGGDCKRGMKLFRSDCLSPAAPCCMAVLWSDVLWSDVLWSDVLWSDVLWSDVLWSDVLWSDSQRHERTNLKASLVAATLAA
ncbi:hypothetical protein QBC46DRAFT_426368, partial [Diplogelasinospora grovesii]